MFALADAQHEEYRIIVDAGLLLQVDDAILTNFHDAVVDSGRDYRKWVELNIAALNHALRGIPEDRVRYHIAGEAGRAAHQRRAARRDGGSVFKVQARGYSIEAANPRHEHEWTVWKRRSCRTGKFCSRAASATRATRWSIRS